MNFAAEAQRKINKDPIVQISQGQYLVRLEKVSKIKTLCAQW
jgi:hypothetical protein